MDALQLDLFSSVDSPELQAGKLVIAVETKIAPFGNRTDLIVVDGKSVRGMSLLECTNPNVEYFNVHSEL